MAHILSPEILRAYDIRGVVGKGLDESDAYWIGRGFGHVLQQQGGQSMCVGRDGRLTSEALTNQLITGLLESGCDVYDIGLGPSPMLYFGEYALDTDGAIMVTGSHNPSAYNGFKFSLGRRSFYGQMILDMAKAIAEDDLKAGSGTLHHVNIANAYTQRILKAFPQDFALHVVWDPGNGAGADIISRLVKTLPGTHTLINGTIDGTFPAHHPDPTVAANLVQLQDTVKNQGADIGFAFDGDADRIGAVDSQGRIFWGDQILTLLAREILQRHPGTTIIADVKASSSLFQDIERCGGIPLMWKSGHSHIKTKMKETGSLLAGEMSGHIFIADDYYGFDDGIYSALRLLASLWKSGKTPAEAYETLPQTYVTEEIRIPCTSDKKFKVAEDMAAQLNSQGIPFSDIDGVRASLSSGWWLIRASNTQDEIVIRCEGSSSTDLNATIDHLVEHMESSGFNPQNVAEIKQYKLS